MHGGVHTPLAVGRLDRLVREKINVTPISNDIFTLAAVSLNDTRCRLIPNGNCGFINGKYLLEEWVLSAV